jgi:hypothetical protein
VPSALCGAGRAAPAACAMVSAITTDTEMTLAKARAAGRDAGDRSMRKAGRKAWSWDDWNEAARVTSALLAAATSDPRRRYARLPLKPTSTRVAFLRWLRPKARMQRSAS